MEKKKRNKRKRRQMPQRMTATIKEIIESKKGAIN